MIRNIQFSLQQRPTWQRYLIFAATIVLTAVLFWVAFFFVIGFAFLALAVAMINKLKFKLTGRPLFKGPQHFHRYQSQFSRPGDKPSGNVIEGEVIKKDSE